METSSLTFARPAWLLALVLLPMVAALMLWSWSRGSSLVDRIVAPRLRPVLAGSASTALRALKAVLALAACALAVAAIAGPQLGYIEREVPQRGRDILLAIDTSRSMLATDLAPDRLTRAKLFAKDLLGLAAGDRLGLIAFAGSAFLQAPLTMDRGAVVASIEELDTSIIPKGGTNIAAAIRLAERAFGKGEAQSRALIILSDGEELDADGVRAAREAAALGIRIFTVGAATAEGSLIPIRTADGRNDFVRDPAGKPVNSRLDESRLKEIAEATGGFYTPLGPEAAARIMNEGIRNMQTEERGAFASRQPLDRYAWPLTAACVLLALRLLLGERRRAAKLALLALAISPSAHADDALQAYQQGNFTKARELYEQKLARKPDFPQLQFNTGTAAYQLGDYAKAIEMFSAALASGKPSDNPRFAADSAYNLANALARRGEQAQSKDEKKADWKSAIQHYDTVLNHFPNDKSARENREIVKKLLEELEKEEQQQKKDQQEQQQQQQQQQNQEQQNQEQQQKDQQQDQKNNQDQQRNNQDQQQQNPQEPRQREDQKKDQNQQQEDQSQQQQEQKNEGSQQQQRKDEQQQGQEQEEPSPGDSERGEQQPSSSGPRQPPPPIPTPTPGDKKEGELRPAREQEGQEEAPMAEVPEAEERDGQMSERQARALLNSLRNEEERVQIMRPLEQQETLRDW